MRFSQITLLHDRDDTPDGFVQALEEALKSEHPMVRYARPLMPDFNAKKALEWFELHYLYRVLPDSLLMGIGTGGLIACALQTAIPALRLSVCAINAPTVEDGVAADQRGSQRDRLALYSSVYPPIQGRCGWKAITPLAYDLAWLADGCKSFYPLAYLISVWSQDAPMDKEVSMLFPPGLGV